MSEIFPQFDEAKKLMNAAQRIVIISHRNPDADAVGANLALREILESKGKTVRSACIDPPPQDCDFLVKRYPYIDDFNLNEFDLVITVDCGAHQLVGFHERMPELLKHKVPMINIDHHPSNDNFGTVNIVMPETPSTCFILYLMFSYYQWDITSTMATAMLHGLYYDTGSFMHSNTDAHTLRVASRLKALGGNHEICVKKQFHTSSIEKLRLWGKALSRLSMNKKEAAVTAITQDDLASTQSTFNDISGLINYLNQVPEAKFCVLLCEDDKGNIKGSFRTQREDIDLTAIAGLFGGGGHKKAAGFTMPGRLVEKKIWSIASQEAN